jgi:hypothetical protein
MGSTGSRSREWRLNKRTKKVIDMEIESTNHQDVAEPDQIASGMAGTGQENEELEWARRHIKPDPYLAERKTEIIGWGVRPVHKRGWRSRQKIPKEIAGTAGAGMTAPTTVPTKPEKSPAEMIVILARRIERITERLAYKIGRLDKRVRELENRGRS